MARINPIVVELQMTRVVEILNALDELACALADHDHVWTTEERSRYEKAVRDLLRE